MVKQEVPFTNDLLDRLAQAGHSMVDSSVVTSANPLSSGQIELIENAMRTLTESEMRILLLRFWQNKTFREIQVEMKHKSISTTHRKYMKAIGKLRVALGDKMNTEVTRLEAEDEIGS